MSRADAPKTGRDPSAHHLLQVGGGWCATCYQDGQFVPAWSQPAGTVCAVHASAAATPPSEDRPPGAPPPARPRRQGPHQPPARRAPRRNETTARRARRLRYGRRRAAARLRHGRYDPHPGLENFLPAGRLRDQATALRVVDDLIAVQPWRADRRAAWGAILRHLVHRMDWVTGLVCAVTAGQLAAAGQRAARTLSRVIAWAVQQGLIVIAEQGASAAFLGTERGRTPTYALYRPPGLAPAHPPTPPAAVAMTPPDQAFSLLGDLPIPEVSTKPLRGRRPPPANPDQRPWPLFGIPQTPTDRERATRRLLSRLGLDGRGVSPVAQWRARALLIRWWRQGACPAGLLHALEHHPDQPRARRGPAARGARDPLRVLAYRLKPWDGRLGELPVSVRGLHGDYTQAYRDKAERHDPPPAHDRAPTWTPSSNAEHRAALRAQFAHHRLITRVSGRASRT